MLQIALCDDEKQQRLALHSIITTELDLKGNEYKISEFESGEDLCTSIKAIDYDIIYLDIEMKHLNGIETAKIIRTINKKAVIIFVTAYADYVFQGYEVRAFHYILKPYNRKKIAEVLSSALEQLQENQDKYYVIESKSGSYRLDLNNILYFYSDKRKIHAVTRSDNIEFYEKLDTIEQNLPKFFERIHQRYLVNLNYVTAIETNYVSLGTELLPVSRVRYQQLMIDFAKLMLH